MPSTTPLASTPRLPIEPRPDGIHIRLPEADSSLLSALLRRLRSQRPAEARWIHLGRTHIALPDGQNVALSDITRIDDQAAICTTARTIPLSGGLPEADLLALRAALREHTARHVANHVLRNAILRH